MNVIKGYSYVFSYIILVMSISVLLGKYIFHNYEMSRKTIHAAISFTWLILCKYFVGTIHFCIIPSIFLIMNLIVYIYSNFPLEKLL